MKEPIICDLKQEDNSMCILRDLQSQAQRGSNLVLTGSRQKAESIQVETSVKWPVDGSYLVCLIDRLQSPDNNRMMANARSLIAATFYYKTNLQCISRVDMLIQHGLQVGIRKGTG